MDIRAASAPRYINMFGRAAASPQPSSVHSFTNGDSVAEKDFPKALAASLPLSRIFYSFMSDAVARSVNVSEALPMCQ